MGWRRYFRRRDEDAELAREIEAHLGHQTDDNIAVGIDPVEARRRALLKFGGVTNVREDVWEWNTVSVLDDLWRDFRYVMRTVRRAPRFATAVILVMALGIGGVTAMFTIVRSVLLKPLPFREPERLVRLYEHSADGKFPHNVASGGVFAEWKKQSHGFSDLAFFFPWSAYNLSGVGGQLPEKVKAGECSRNLFPMLGVEPALGRGFTEDDDRLSANGTVILSWSLWKRRFGGDSEVLGRKILLHGRPYIVIGVMPAWFTYPERSIQLWTPIYHEESAEMMEHLDWHNFTVVGRLKPEISEQQAVAELSLIVRHLHDQHLDNPYISDAANSRPLLEDVVGDAQTPLYVLLAATGCLLLIACLNVANLLTARAAARKRELAIRTALGSSRWRILREHFVETLMLSAGGGAAGLLLATVVVHWVVSMRADMTRVDAIHIDGVVLAFTFGCVLACGALAGLISAASTQADKLLSGLQESSRSYSAGGSRVRLRRWLLALEVGVTVVLLIGAGLLLKSYQRLRASDLGCITNNVLIMRFSLPETQYVRPEQRVTFFETLLERVRSLPGVQAATLTHAVPGQGYMGDSGFAIAEHPPAPVGHTQEAMTRWCDPGYFSALGIPFLRGQTFESSHRLDKAKKVIVSESLAKRYFVDEDPIGKHLLTMGEKPYEIIGVVSDTRYEVSKSPGPTMYFPLYGGGESGVTLAVRSGMEVTRLALPIQQIVQHMDPQLPVSDVMTMNELIGKSTIDANFDATLLLTFAGLSLLLASVGLYGVLSYLVTQRESELGLRMALGALPGEVLRLTLADGLRPTALGLVFGLAAGAAATRLIRDLLYGVQPMDASVFVGVAIVLVGISIAACLLPAWRASRLDPVKALRMD